MPDEEVVLDEEQEVALSELLVTGAEDEVDEEEVELTGEETADELREQLKEYKERVSKRNKSLKKAKEAQHRTQQEKDALAQRMDTLEGKLGGQQPDVVADSNVLNVQEIKDRVADAPEEIVDIMIQQMATLENKFAEVLQAKFGEFGSQLQSLTTNTNPDVQKYAKQIELLQSRPEFAGKDVEELLPTAKLIAQSVKQPRGTVTGAKVTKSKQKGLVLTKEDETEMGFDED